MIIPLFRDSLFYIEYPFSGAEIILRGFVSRLGIEFETPVLVYELQRITEDSWVNFGYKIEIPIQKTAYDVGIKYERWVNIDKEMPLGEAVKVLSDDLSAYQCLKLSLSTKEFPFNLHSMPDNPTGIVTTRQDLKTVKMLNRFIKEYQSAYEYLGSFDDYQVYHFYRFYIPFLEICSKCIDMVRSDENLVII